jgi:tetratricopeptide (TPR) repeat protein
MSRIFISHSSLDNKAAEDARDWLIANGWSDIFLDLDPVRGLAPGERWQNALKLAADRCEAVIFLISPNWLASRWCLSEFLLAKQLGKRLFPVIVGDVAISSLPLEMSADHQVVDVVNDPQGRERLKQGLKRAGLDADSFAFPAGRRVYPGFEPLTEDDAAIFFGRDAQILRGLDRLRLMRDAGAERLMVIVGASGAGKSSFLRAGLWPRLRRDDRNFWPLPIVRPERAALSGRAGLFAAFESALADPRIASHPALASFPKSRAAIGEIVSREGPARLLAAFRLAAAPLAQEAASPTLVLCIDQAEELLNKEGSTEAHRFQELLAAAIEGEPHLLVVVAIRSDAYPMFQVEPALVKIPREPFDLPPMPEGSLRSVIEGPAQFAEPPVKLEASFVDALLADAKGQDALPLMAFTLSRLIREYGADGRLSLQAYTSSGGMRGTLAAAVDEALARAREIVARDEKQLETLLHRAFVPNLARVNEAGEFARRIALATEIPAASMPLVDVLVEARLLIRDQTARGEIIEVAHEALLREWPLLRRFLEADRDFLVGKRQLAEDLSIWREAPTQQKADALLSGLRLTRAQQWLVERDPHDLNDEERAFIGESVKAAQARQRWRTRAAAAIFLLLAAFSLLAVWQWTEARHEATIAQQNEQEAKREKDRADQNAADALAQKNIAEQQKLLATQQAQRSDARAELIQAQFMLKDAPLDALRKAASAARQLDSLDSGDEALSLLWPVLNSARQLPRFQPYSHYPLGGISILVRQPPPKAPAGPAAEPPRTKTYSIVAGYDVSGVIDDDGKEAGPPFGSGEIDGSYANDAVWLDDGSFVVAQGAWSGPAASSVLRNSGLGRRTVGGKQIQDYLPDYKIPVMSVALIGDTDKKTLVAGDAFGNFIIIGPDDKANIISTGIGRPITRIVSLYKRVVLLFGSAIPDAPKSDAPAVDVEAQRKQISMAIGSSAEVTYVGDKTAGEFGCAIAADMFELYVCDRNSVSVMSFDDGEPIGKIDRTFSAHSDYVSAIALSPASPILATGSTKGELRLWLKSGELLAELRTMDSQPITALGFIDNGRRLLVSQNGVTQWDISDLANLVSNWPTYSGSWAVERMRRKAWAEFSDQKFTAAPNLEEVAEKRDSEFYYSYKPYGTYLISDQPRGLRILNAQTAEFKDVNLIEQAVDTKSRGNFENSIIADRSGKVSIVVIGTYDGFTPPAKPDQRHIYAIDDAAGVVIADWDLPAELKNRRIMMVSSQSGEHPVYWIAADHDVFLFTPDDKQMQHFRLPQLLQGQIQLISPRENSREFVAVMQLQGAAASTASLLKIPRAADPDAPASNTSPEESRLIASTSIASNIVMASISADGSRIALAIGKGRSDDLGEVRIFGRSFQSLLNLPGSDGSFDWFQLGPDGQEIRAVGSSSRYWRDLRLNIMMDKAAQLTKSWDDEADRAQAYKNGTEEKDVTKAKAVLSAGVAAHPLDLNLTLILANRKFYFARDQKEKDEAMQLYDKSNAIDPYEPIAHYMRGRARAALGNYDGAIADFSDAIALPHILPLVKVIAGFLQLNQGIAALSYQLNLQSRAELFTRRAMARGAKGDWQLLLDDDLHWVRANNMRLFALQEEIEGLALDNTGKPIEAIADFQQAAKSLEADKSYGLDDFKALINDPVWRAYKLALYQKKIGDIDTKLGKTEDAADAYRQAQKLVDDASALPNLAGASRALLAAFSTLPPDQRCGAEGRLRSIGSYQGTQIVVSDQHPSDVRLYWLDFGGKRKLYATIKPGTQYTQQTFDTHSWVVTDADDKCLAVLVPDIGQTRYTVH